MGALDDAIREHLELKRRHGASEEEVAQQEREALELGALRSGGDDRGSQHSARDAQVETVERATEEDFESSASPGAAPEVSLSEQPESIMPPGLPPTGGISDELEPDEVLPEEALDPEPPGPRRSSPPRDGAPPAGTARPSPERQGDGDAQAEDVLQETPDFLEEAPEHDRLWFEQRPPKDFDFDD